MKFIKKEETITVEHEKVSIVFNEKQLQNFLDFLSQTNTFGLSPKAILKSSDTEYTYPDEKN